MMGFEPTTPGITIRCSNQLSYTHQILLPTLLANGAPGRTRTCNRRLRRPVLYPVELRALGPNCRTGGRGRGIRTPDILLPKQARYQTALYPAAWKLPLRANAAKAGYCPEPAHRCQRAVSLGPSLTR